MRRLRPQRHVRRLPTDRCSSTRRISGSTRTEARAACVPAESPLERLALRIFARRCLASAPAAARASRRPWGSGAPSAAKSCCCAVECRAANRSIRPTRQCASRTSRLASSCACKMSARSTWQAPLRSALPPRLCRWRALTLATSAPGLRPPPATSAPGLGLRLPHLHSTRAAAVIPKYLEH